LPGAGLEQQARIDGKVSTSAALQREATPETAGIALDEMLSGDGGFEERRLRATDFRVAKVRYGSPLEVTMIIFGSTVAVLALAERTSTIAKNLADARLARLQAKAPLAVSERQVSEATGKISSMRMSNGRQSRGPRRRVRKRMLRVVVRGVTVEYTSELHERDR